MNKDAIKKTAICRYSKADKCFIVESPIFDRASGVAGTEKDAYRIFLELLDDIYLAYLEGRLSGHPNRGRPAKGGVDLHAQVRPATKKDIAKLSKSLGISQGEAVDYLLHFHKAHADSNQLALGAVS